MGLVELARCTPSGGNKQWLRYALVNESGLCAEVFGTLGWAAYLKDWPGPDEGERPAGYIVLLEDSSHGAGLPLDAGIAAQTIMLGAVELGLGGCMIASVARDRLARVLHLPQDLRIALVLALGEPVEEVHLDPLPASGSIEYWREGAVHHVPKRALHDIVVSVNGQVE